MDHLRCRSCNRDVVPVRPRSGAKILNFTFWIASLATATAFSLLLGLDVVLVPLWFAIGMSVGTSAARLRAWSCPACKSEVVVPPEMELELRRRPREHRRLAPQPA
jgi:hypothetical protein